MIGPLRILMVQKSGNPLLWEPDPERLEVHRVDTVQEACTSLTQSEWDAVVLDQASTDPRLSELEAFARCADGTPILVARRLDGAPEGHIGAMPIHLLLVSDQCRSAVLEAAIRVNQPQPGFKFSDRSVDWETRFDDWCHSYADMLEHSLLRGGDAPARNDLHSLAGDLVAQGAGPREVVEIHRRTMGAYFGNGDAVARRHCAEEGRLLLVELLGHLAAGYRTRLQEAVRGSE